MSQALIKHFKLSESDVAQIQSSLQPTQTLLEALFEKHLIDPVAYIQWAKDHYSLPVLKIDFLNKNNNVDALLDRYKNVFPKNVIPFHEFDGTLYVMCLEPTPFDAPQAVQYVLAPFEVIQKYAAKNETSIVHQAAAEVAQVKEETNPLFKDLTGAGTKEKSALDDFSFDNLEVGKDTAPSENPESAPEFPSAPEGAEEIKLEEKQDVPAGMDFPPAPSENELIVTDGPVTAVDLMSFKFEGLQPVFDGYKNPDGAPAPKTVIMTADSLVAKHPPKNKPPQAAAQAPAQPEAPQPAAAPVMPPPVMPAQPVAPPTPMPSAAPTAASPFDGILQSMKKYFEQSMVLVFNNGALEPKAWDASWAKAPHAQSAIDVSTPSIFRIVNESQHPYHGHIVPNPINEYFFTTWNKGQYPQHITICPIVNNKKVVGMILGATTKDGAKKYQLHHVQEIANDAISLLNSAKAA